MKIDLVKAVRVALPLVPLVKVLWATFRRPKPRPLPIPMPVPVPVPVPRAAQPSLQESLVKEILFSVFKKFAASSVKALLSVAIAALVAASGVAGPSDAVAGWVWGLLVAGLHAVISALGRLIEKLNDAPAPPVPQ